MDLKTGRMYDSMEDGRKDGVPESDLFQVSEDFAKAMRPQTLKFGKSPFSTIKNRALENAMK